MNHILFTLSYTREELLWGSSKLYNDSSQSSDEEIFHVWPTTFFEGFGLFEDLPGVFQDGAFCKTPFRRYPTLHRVGFLFGLL